MFVCKKCLNPAYKDGLCVEHYDKIETGEGPHTFIIVGPSELFKGVKAFKVYSTYEENELEIRIKGHAIDDYPKMRTLVNTHFKGAVLYVSFFIPAEEFEEYEIIWNEYSRCKKNGMVSGKMWSAEITIGGVRFEVRDDNYMRMEYWESTLKRELGGFIEWCRRRLANEAIKHITNFQFDD